MSASTTCARTPEYPRERVFARSRSIPRTASSSSGSPSPDAWLRMSRRWSWESLIVGDANAREVSEPGVHAVHGIPGFEGALHRALSCHDSRPRLQRERAGCAAARHRIEPLQVERFAVEDDGRGHRVRLPTTSSCGTVAQVARRFTARNHRRPARVDHGEPVLRRKHCEDDSVHELPARVETPSALSFGGVTRHAAKRST